MFNWKKRENNKPDESKSKAIFSGGDQGEDALRREKAFLESALNTISDIFYAFDLKGKFLYWNKAVKDVTGYSDQEVALKKPTDFFSVKDIVPISGAILRIFRDGFAKQEADLVLKDGRKIPYELTGSVLRDGKGKVIGFSGTGRDLTERNQAEKEIAKAEALKIASAYTRSLIEASLDPFVAISQEGKITDVNESTIKATGISREKLIGTDFSDYFTEPEKAREAYLEAFKKGFVSDYPLTIRHKDGKLIDVLYNASVYRDDSGNILGVFAAARDITERKRAENELKSKYDELERFRKATIDREFRMEELRQEIEKLKGIKGAV
jgi:PAS domain S-box-containing protein